METNGQGSTGRNIKVDQLTFKDHDINNKSEINHDDGESNHKKSLFGDDVHDNLKESELLSSPKHLLQEPSSSSPRTPINYSYEDVATRTTLPNYNSSETSPYKCLSETHISRNPIHYPPNNSSTCHDIVMNKTPLPTQQLEYLS